MMLVRGSSWLRERPWGKVLLAFWLLWVLFPVYWTAINAFKTGLDIYGGARFLPFVDFTPTLLPWDEIVGGLGAWFVRDLTNSLLFSTVSAALAVLVGAPAAYGLARYQYRYGPLTTERLTVLLVAQRLLPAIVIVLPLYVIYSHLGLLDTPAGMIFAYAATSLPLVIYVLRPFLSAVPAIFEESAAVDGYPRMLRLWHIALPLAWPGLAAAYLLAFFAAWTDFVYVVGLTFNQANTLPFLVVALTDDDEGELGAAAAVCLVMLGAALVTTLVASLLIPGAAGWRAVVLGRAFARMRALDAGKE